MTAKVVSVDAPASGARRLLQLACTGCWLMLLGLGKAISLSLYVCCLVPVFFLRLFASGLGASERAEDEWTSGSSKTLTERIEDTHRWDPETYQELYGRYPDRFNKD